MARQELKTFGSDGQPARGAAAFANAASARLPLLEVAAFSAVFLVFLALYWSVGFPIYNDAYWLDPWYYTGLFVNFHFLHSTFPSAYYVTRLPWLIPGRIVFGLFPPVVAYVVLHLVFGVAAAAFLYLTSRRFFGVPTALVTLVAAAANPLFYSALYRDYVNAGEITYFLGGMYFGLVARTGKHPRLSMAAAGFLLTAAFATHFLSAVFSAGLIVPYLLLFRPTLPTIVRDALAVAAGVVALLFGCGVYSVANGGPFNFLGPALAAGSQLSVSSYRRSGLHWLLAEPWMLVPFFLCAVVAIFLFRKPDFVTDRYRSGMIALAAYGGLMYVVVIVWEVVGGMVLLEWFDYFQIFYSAAVLPLLAAAVAAVVAWAPSVAREKRTAVLAVLAAVVCAMLPALALYRGKWTARVGEAALIPVGVLMVTTLVVCLVQGSARLRWPAAAGPAMVAAVALLALSTAYPVYASDDVRRNMDFSHSENALNSGVFHVGIAWVRWMQAEGLQEQHMVTWYDGKTTPQFAGIASLYFYGWVLQDANMPHINGVFRENWKQRDPTEVVLLCRTRNCEAAPSALESAGYRIRFAREREFVHGPVRLWVRVFSVRT